jgi:hypothetical protein
VIPARLLGKNCQELTNTVTGEKIPVIASKGLVFSCWQFSPEEQKLVADGKPVWLVQRGEYIPDMVLSVGDEASVVPASVRKEMIVGDPMAPVNDQVVAEKRKLQAQARTLVRAVFGAAAIVVLCLGWHIALALWSR